MVKINIFIQIIIKTIQYTYTQVISSPSWVPAGWQVKGRVKCGGDMRSAARICRSTCGQVHSQYISPSDVKSAHTHTCYSFVWGYNVFWLKRRRYEMNMNHLIAFNHLNLVFLNKYFTFNLNILITTGYSSFDFIKAPGYKIYGVMNKLNKEIIKSTDRETKPKSKTTSNLYN